MSWIEGLEAEEERYRKLIAEERLHLVLEASIGNSIRIHREQTPRQTERIHIIIDGPSLQPPRE